MYTQLYVLHFIYFFGYFVFNWSLVFTYKVIVSKICQQRCELHAIVCDQNLRF